MKFKIIIPLIIISILSAMLFLSRPKPNMPALSEKSSTTPTAMKISQKQPDSKQENIQPQIKKDPYRIYSHVLSMPNIHNMDLYKILYDGIDHLDSTVDISSVSSEELDAVILALWDKISFEFFYLKDIEVSKDGKKVLLTYNDSVPNLHEKKSKLDQEIDHILTTVVKAGDTDLEKELAVYKYICDHASSPLNNAPSYNLYNVLVEKNAICLGFSVTLFYLYDRLGFENYIVFGDIDDSPYHAWNIIKLGDQYYHIDGMWDGEQKELSTLRYFNMTDGERNAYNSFEDGWYVGNRAYKKVAAPSCTDPQFSFLRNCTNYALSQGGIQYTDALDQHSYWISLNGQTKKAQ